MPNPSLFIQTVLFQIIQFDINTQFSSIWPIDRTLSGATIPSQCGPGSDDNEGVLHIPQISSITGTTPSEFRVISRTLVDGVLHLCREAVGVFYSPRRLGKNDRQSVKLSVIFFLQNKSILTKISSSQILFLSILSHMRSSTIIIYHSW